eukprot:gene4413-6240_t
MNYGYENFDLDIIPPDDNEVDQSLKNDLHIPPHTTEHCNNSSIINYNQKSKYYDTENDAALEDFSMQSAFENMVTDVPIERPTTMVVLDGANLGWNYGVDSFRVKGITLAISYFKRFKVDIKCFIPVSYIKSKPKASDPCKDNAMMQTDDWEILNSLLFQSILAPVPANENDDAYILAYGRNHNGFIISNDLFRDHIEKMQPQSAQTSMKLWITENRCGYLFIQDEFMLNPSSTLAMTLNSYSAAEKLDEVPTNDNVETIKMTLSLMNRTIDSLISMSLADELKYLLLARANIYIKLGLKTESYNDINFILSSLDNNCMEAQQFARKFLS